MKGIKSLPFLLSVLFFWGCPSVDYTPFPPTTGIYFTADFIRNGQSMTLPEDTLTIRNLQNDVMLKTQYDPESGLQSTRIDTFCTSEQVGLLIFESDSLLGEVTLILEERGRTDRCILTEAYTDDFEIVTQSVFSVGIRVNK